MMKRHVLLIGIALGVMPVAHADTGDCASPCSISTSTTAYTAPVNVIKSGSTVKWVPGDGGSHPTSDIPADQDPCFYASVGAGHPGVSITFKITNGVLSAKNGTITKNCSSTALPNGDRVLPFQCNVHGWMRGELLVHP